MPLENAKTPVTAPARAARATRTDVEVRACLCMEVGRMTDDDSLFSGKKQDDCGIIRNMHRLFPTGRTILLSIALIGALFPSFARAQTATEAPVPANGSFIQAESGDPRVYYIENGLKRWIQTAEAFNAHDFNWEDIVIVPSSTVSRFFDGEPITVTTNLALPSEKEVLPDLIPFAAQDLRFDVVDGRKVLRFTTIFWNAGHGKFEVVSRRDAT